MEIASAPSSQSKNQMHQITPSLRARSKVTSKNLHLFYTHPIDRFPHNLGTEPVSKKIIPPAYCKI